jgi:hypothetical protein
LLYGRSPVLPGENVLNKARLVEDNILLKERLVYILKCLWQIEMDIRDETI